MVSLSQSDLTVQSVVVESLESVHNRCLIFCPFLCGGFFMVIFMRITILISVFSWCCHSLTKRVTQKKRLQCRIPAGMADISFYGRMFFCDGCHGQNAIKYSFTTIIISL